MYYTVARAIGHRTRAKDRARSTGGGRVIWITYYHVL